MPVKCTHLQQDPKEHTAAYNWTLLFSYSQNMLHKKCSNVFAIFKAKLLASHWSHLQCTQNAQQESQLSLTMIAAQVKKNWNAFRGWNRTWVSRVIKQTAIQLDQTPLASGWVCLVLILESLAFPASLSFRQTGGWFLVFEYPTHTRTKHLHTLLVHNEGYFLPKDSVRHRSWPSASPHTWLAFAHIAKAQRAQRKLSRWWWLCPLQWVALA